MRRTSQLPTEVVCGHHDAVLVFDCENAGSRNDGLSMQNGFGQETDGRCGWTD